MNLSSPCLRHVQNPASRAQAEQTLLQFRNSPQALNASQYILQHSQDVQAQFQVGQGPTATTPPASATSCQQLMQGLYTSFMSSNHQLSNTATLFDPQPCFVMQVEQNFLCQHHPPLFSLPQAVLALRHATLAGWAALPTDTRRGVLQFLLQFAMHAAATPQPLVQAQCAAAAAAVIKRGWEEMAVEERHAVMHSIDSAAAQTGAGTAVLTQQIAGARERVGAFVQACGFGSVYHYRQWGSGGQHCVSSVMVLCSEPATA